MIDIIRVLTLILLSIASGSMIKFYVTQPRMPWLAFGGLLGATISMSSSLIIAIHKDPDSTWGWWLTPPILLYSVCIIVALRRFLTVKN